MDYTTVAYRLADFEYWTGSAWQTATAVTQVLAARDWRIKPAAQTYTAKVSDDDPYLNDSSSAGDPHPEVTTQVQRITITSPTGTNVINNAIFSADSASINVLQSTNTNGTTSPTDDTMVSTTLDVYSVYTMGTWGGAGATQPYLIFGGGRPQTGVIYRSGSLNATASDNNTYGYDTTVANVQLSSLTVCFAAGTGILTDQGEVPVETLAKGDLVMTCDHGLQPIRWIGTRTLRIAEHADPQRLLPVRIKAGALGKNMPEKDLYVSQQHRILVKSKIAERLFGAPEVLVAAKKLLDIEGISLVEDCQQVTYIHFMFDAHEIVMSNGARTESLYTGPEALKAVGEEARTEILTLFPQLAQVDYHAPSARRLLLGREARKLTERHVQRDKFLYAE